MSFLDSLGGMAQGIGDFTGLTDAWHDFASAFTDNGEDDNIFNDVGQALRGSLRVVASPLVLGAHALGAGIDNAYTAANYTAAAGTLGWNILHDQNSQPGDSFADLWNRNFDATIGSANNREQAMAGVTFGQSYAQTLLTPAGLSSVSGSNLGDKNIASMTPQERDKTFGSGALKWGTGTTDVVYSTVMDPTNLLFGVGKAARFAYQGKEIVRTSPNALKRGWQINDSALQSMLNDATPDSALGQHFDWLAQSDALTISKSKEAKRTGDATTFAYLMGKAQTPEEVRDVYTVLGRLGTDADVAAAASRLGAADAARGGVAAETEYLANRIANGGVDEAVDGLVNVEQHAAIYAHHLTDAESSISRAYQQILDRAANSRAPVVTRAPGTGAFLRQNERVATKRASRYSAVTPTVALTQPTRFHPVMAVADFFTRERTSGWVNFHESDSLNEIAALVDDIDRVTNGALRNSGEGRAWLNQYAASATNADRMRLAMAMERRGFELIAAERGIDGETARKMWAATFDRRAKAVAQHRDSGFVSYLLDGGDTAIAKIPLLERQGANTLPLIDFTQVTRAIDRHDAGALKTAFGGVGRGLVTAADVVNDVFKISVLLRLGYTVRNIAEAGASMFVSGYMGDVLMTASKDSARAWAQNRRAGVERIVDRVQVARGKRVDAEVALRDLADADAQVRAHQMVLDGVRDGALKRANLNISSADQELFRSVREGLPLAPEEAARVEELRSHFLNVAQLRTETSRRTTYHASQGDVRVINGDYIDTTPSFGVASARADDAYTVSSWETVNRVPRAFADPTGEGRIPNRLKAGYAALMDEAQAALDAGKIVEVRRGSTWRPLNQESLAALRARTSTRGDARALVRYRDPQVQPNVIPFESYGEELNLTNLASWPDDLKELLNVRHGRPRQTARRRASAPSHREWVANESWNDPDVAALLTQYARDNGYGRIILPSREWGQTVRLIKDTVEGHGGQGAMPIVKRNVDAITREAEENAVVGALPRPRDAAGNRAARRMATRTRRLSASSRAHINGVPVVPGYNEAVIEAMLDQGIQPAIRQAVNNLATAKATAEAARTQLTGVRARQARMKGGARTGTSDMTIMTDFGPVRAPGAFSGAQGEIMYRATHGDATNERLVGDGTAILSSAIPQAVSTRVMPNEPRYFEAWSNILNWHWRDPSSGRIDPVVERLLAGESREDVVTYLAHTREGRAYADEIGWGSEHQIEDAVDALTQSIPLYLPTPEIVDLWRAGALDAEGLSARLGGRTDLPEVNGLLVPQSREYSDSVNLLTIANAGTRKVFYALGAGPETTFARHPLFKADYARRMNDMLPKAAAQKGEALTLDEVNEIAAAAREQARKTVNKTLFTINRRTGAAQKLRIVSPFYAAWENVVRRWGTFAVQNTEGIVRGGVLVERLLDNAVLVNSNTGDKAELGKDSWQDIAMIMPWDVGGNGVRVPITSLDVITQGQPGNPGIGPFVALPLVKVVERTPRAEQILTWAFPVGVPRDEMDVFLPAFARRLKSAVTQDQSFVNDANRIAQMEAIRFERGERNDLPKWSEIEDKARKLYALRALSNLTLPFSPQYTNDVNYYSEELRRYRTVYGPDQGDAKFLIDRPEAFVVLESLSQNNTGARANYQAVDNMKRYSDLAAEADGLGDPQLIGWLANYGQGEYDANSFSPAAYSWQLENSAVPGGEAFRTKKNPTEIYREAQIGKGWVEFRSFMDTIESSMPNYGVDPASAQGTWVMGQARKFFGQFQQTQNPEWYQDYVSNDRSRFDKRVQFFESALQDPTFMKDHGNDPTVKGIAAFLQIRSEMAATLLDNPANGGSKSLSAKSNAALVQAYNARITQLKSESLGFADWYDRYFTNDPVVL